MFDVIYDIVEETYRCENTVRTSYGIAAYDARNGVSDVFASLHDISKGSSNTNSPIEYFRA